MIIVIEGTDGSGKTTTAKQLAEDMKFGYIHYPYYENDTGKKILQYLSGEVSWDPLSFQALQTCNRIETIDMLEKLERKNYGVIIDRYNISTYVYGQLDGLNFDLLKTFCSVLPKPDMEIIIISDKPYRLSKEDFYEKMEKWTITKELYIKNANCKPSEKDSRCTSIVQNNGTIEECVENCKKIIKEFYINEDLNSIMRN